MSGRRTADPTVLASAWRKLVKAMAERELGRSTGASIVKWAEDALRADVDTPSLRVLAGLTVPPNEFEVDRYLGAASAELQQALPERGALLSLYALHVAEDIVNGSVPPREGARDLYDVSKAAGSLAELSTWSGLDDAWTMAESGTYGTVEEVQADIIKQAQLMVDRSAAQRTLTQ